MVGGLADWFAVTALFRRPLGLPIPHTALIPRQKDRLATALCGYVTSTFLSPTVVGPYLAKADPVGRGAAWMLIDDHPEAVEVWTVLKHSVGCPRPRHYPRVVPVQLVQAVALVVRHREGLPVQPAAGRLAAANGRCASHRGRLWQVRPLRR